ncbi:MAG TPA: phosphonate ABC transporter, permease protein PhnE [Chloroflexi bacterium]|nr:phosphonate ABC transporter, permease protein PhnE [Chloroflexota bacterium]
MTFRTAQQDAPPSLVPPPVAGAASLILPGLGQVLARQLQRGLTLLGSLITIIALLAWRVSLLAPRETGVFAKLGKAVSRRPVFVIPVLLGLAALWLWSAWDAYQQAQPQKQHGIGLFALVILLLFVLGWQTSQIDMYKFVTQISDARGALTRVAWPWSAAVTRDTETVGAGADILSPCDDDPPPPIPEATPGEPYLAADPTCGDLATRDENLEEVPGTTLHIVGRNFDPHTETQLWWVDPIGNEFRMRKGGEYISFLTGDGGEFEMDVNMPYRIIPPSSEGRQIHRIEARQTSEVGPLKPSAALRNNVERMVETIVLGMMATFFGILFSIPVSFLAAKNLMSVSPLTLTIYYVTRTILNIVRSIEPMIWVLLAVMVVGLGPFAGVIALTIHSIAALGKLYSEAIESIDPGQIEAVEATGATRLQTIAYAVVPQMIPPFVSFSIYRWDINVRMSTIIGLVGGGGIGFLLIQYIRLLDYRSAGIAVWFIAITVAILDYVSAEIRERFV